MLCRYCGHDNPRQNRYCGMCGTPFPYRELASPDTQSTLVFSPVPQIAVEALPAVEPIASELPIVLAAPAESLEPLLQGTPPQLGEPEFAATEPQIALSQPPRTEIAAAEASLVATGAVGSLLEALQPELAEPKIASVDAEGALPERVKAEIVSSEAEAAPSEPSQTETSTPAPELPDDLVSPPALMPEEPAPPTVEPPIALSAPGPREAPGEAAAVVLETAQSASPGPGVPLATAAPAAITPPSAPAGVPTFQSVNQSAGSVIATPFEPSNEPDADEERELREFVARFRYTPPKETEDELTMRSEVPVFDPHANVTHSHPGFENDELPPPEARELPGESPEHPVAEGDVRSRFLDLEPQSSTPAAPDAEPQFARPAQSDDSDRFLETQASPQVDPADNPSPVVPSFLHVDQPPASIPTGLAPVARRHDHWWLVAGLVTILAALGALEWTSRQYHAYPGPIEVARSLYDWTKQRAPTPASHAETTPDAASNQPAATPQPPASSSSETGSPNAAIRDQSSRKTGDDRTLNPAPDLANNPKPPARDTAQPGSEFVPGTEELAKADDASDATAAAAWLWKSVAKGNPIAPVRLASMYVKGEGVPQSCDQALLLLRSASIKENALARNRLASFYAKGTCVPRDRVKAYQLMSSALAADPTSEWAEKNRQALWRQMNPQERAEAERYR